MTRSEQIMVPAVRVCFAECASSLYATNLSCVGSIRLMSLFHRRANCSSSR